MQIVRKWLASVLFKLAYGVFRSPFLKSSARRHRVIMRVFRFCAEQQVRDALSVYGHLLHFRGEGQENRIQGGIYLQQSADAGDAKAQYQMGKIYEAGFSHYFQPDAAKALAYYRQAAEQQHLLAINRMVQVYSAGELGVEPNQASADQWADRRPDLPVN